MPQAKQNVEVLKQAEVIRNVQNILQVRQGAFWWWWWLQVCV